MSHIPTNEQWATTSIGARKPEAHLQAAKMIDEYRAAPGGAANTEQRKLLLIQLGVLAKSFVTCHSSSPYFGCFVSLGMQIDKELDTIEKSKKAWNKARQVFAAAHHSLGKTNSLQHHQMHADAPTSSGNYWLESLDPKHRSWGHEDSDRLFDRWKADVTTHLNFFDWLEHKHLGQDMPQVQYLAPDERWKFMCVFGRDKTIYRHRAMLNPQSDDGKALDRFTTRGFSTVHSGPHFAIWVCSPQGVFYTYRHELSQFHHSTFLSGGRVLAAGEWVVSDGRLLLVSHKTGHYAATPFNLYRSLQLLKHRLDLSRTVVQITDFQTRSKKYVNAMQFMAQAGRHELCDEITDASGQIANMQTEAVSRCERNALWDSPHSTTLRVPAIVHGDSHRYFTVDFQSHSYL